MDAGNARLVVASQLIKLPTVVDCDKVPTEAHVGGGTQMAVTLDQMKIKNSIVNGMWDGILYALEHL